MAGWEQCPVLKVSWLRAMIELSGTPNPPAKGKIHWGLCSKGKKIDTI